MQFLGTIINMWTISPLNESETACMQLLAAITNKILPVLPQAAVQPSPSSHALTSRCELPLRGPCRVVHNHPKHRPGQLRSLPGPSARRRYRPDAATGPQDPSRLGPGDRAASACPRRGLASRGPASRRRPAAAPRRCVPPALRAGTRLPVTLGDLGVRGGRERHRKKERDL